MELIRRQVVIGFAAATLASGGCMTCRHEGFAESMRVLAANPFPTPVRQQVYLFMMNGEDVLELGGMLTLRDKLCQAGFPKVYYAQKEDRDWFYREMRRLQRDEPTARMLLLGYGTAAERVHDLAYAAVRDGLPLDAVIFLDPSGRAEELCGLPGVPTVMIRSHNWTGAPDLPPTETVPLPAGHVSAPLHPGTLETVVRWMTASAARVVLPTIENLPHLPLRDKLPPTPRGIDPATLGPAPPGWDFLRPPPRLVGGPEYPAVTPPVIPPVPAPPAAGERLPLPRVSPGG